MPTTYGKSLVWLLTTGFAVSACGGGNSHTPHEDPCANASATQGSEEPAAAAEGLDTAEAEGSASTPDEALVAVVAADHRTAEAKARDVYRHPVETLTFFGAEPTMHIVELRPGYGWYTDILAPWLKPEGHLTIAYDQSTDYAKALDEHLASAPEQFDQVEKVNAPRGEKPVFGEPGSADMVLTFRSIHGWYGEETLEDVLAASYDVLKPGGVLGVVQHRAVAGSDPAETAENGYVAEDYVIAAAEKAGFELEARSELNANPKDTKDYPNGVWNLPPSLRLKEGQDEASFKEIGESDRMTLKFRKPAAEATAEEGAAAESESPSEG